jgi:hypothetical protein
MTLYADDGSFNVTEVTGDDFTGLYASDGSYNVVFQDGTDYTGLYHPCGAYNTVEYSEGPVSNVHPCGALYTSTSPYTEGTVKITPTLL